MRRKVHYNLVLSSSFPTLSSFRSTASSFPHTAASSCLIILVNIISSTCINLLFTWKCITIFKFRSATLWGQAKFATSSSRAISRIHHSFSFLWFSSIYLWDLLGKAGNSIYLLCICSTDISSASYLLWSLYKSQVYICVIQTVIRKIIFI